MRVAVCRPQVPFVRGGIEIFADRLVEELQARGMEAEIVSVPFRTWPNDRLATSVMMWRLVDLGADMEMPPDVRLDTAKRVEPLLNAAALDPAVEVVVAGEGPDRERLEELADGHVRFTGHVS